MLVIQNNSPIKCNAELNKWIKNLKAIKNVSQIWMKGIRQIINDLSPNFLPKFVIKKGAMEKKNRSSSFTSWACEKSKGLQSQFEFMILKNSGLKEDAQPTKGEIWTTISPGWIHEQLLLEWTHIDSSSL